MVASLAIFYCPNGKNPRNRRTACVSGAVSIRLSRFWLCGDRQVYSGGMDRGRSFFRYLRLSNHHNSLRDARRSRLFQEFLHAAYASDFPAVLPVFLNLFFLCFIDPRVPVFGTTLAGICALRDEPDRHAVLVSRGSFPAPRTGSSDRGHMVSFHRGIVLPALGPSGPVS